MDLYQQRSHWKLYLGIAGVIIMMVVMWYTSFLAANLRKTEREKVETLVKAFEDIRKEPDNLDRDVSFAWDIVLSNNSIPLISLDGEGNFKDAFNFESTNEEEIMAELDKLKRRGAEPIVFQGPGYVEYIYYKGSALYTKLALFPLIMLLLIAAFMGFGYIMVSASRKAEQNRVWVGMAKETAHQLGTPISAIVAWIEHLKGINEDDQEQLEVLDELDKDVDRLELIADRFSKIGSAPDLEKLNIYDELQHSRDYMQRRASRRVSFDFPASNGSPLYVNINSHLFNWVIENLLRNSLDAMGGEGLIKAEVAEEDGSVVIDITDSGKGIPSAQQKKVFQPGFTTKKRGWGLGLSLAKRIIENYHQGKIFVKRSEQNVGTTFTIKLPTKHN